MTDNGFNLVRSSLARKESSVTSEGQLEPSNEEIKELFAERITSETELPPMQPLFRMFGVPCFYRGELVADCGKAKSGKTFFLSILMATCLTQKVLAIERHVTEGDNENGLHPLRVLWIDTISTLSYSWRSKTSTPAAQIDIIIERADKIVNICEVKYSQDEYILNKEEYDKICKRKNVFIQETGLRHTPWITMITTEGVAQGKYSEMIQSQVRLNELFEI